MHDTMHDTILTPYMTQCMTQVRERCRRVEAICERHGIPLIAAALQFPLLHPAVASVIPGDSDHRERLLVPNNPEPS